MNATPTPKSPEYLRTERRQVAADCGLIEIAPLWPKNGMNLGTLVRTADAVGGCVVVPHEANAAKAIKQGNTIGTKHARIHWIKDPMGWLAWQTARVVAVELAHHATQLRYLRPATEPTIMLLGHEVNGIPKDAWRFVDEAVEIPMFGVGNSLNVAVAGSLVAYKLAGLS